MQPRSETYSVGGSAQEMSAYPPQAPGIPQAQNEQPGVTDAGADGTNNSGGNRKTVRFAAFAACWQLVICFVIILGNLVGTFGTVWEVTSDIAPDFSAKIWPYRATIERDTSIIPVSGGKVDLYIDDWGQIPPLEEGFKLPMIGLMVSFLSSVGFTGFIFLVLILRLYILTSKPQTPMPSRRRNIIRFLIELQQSHVLALGIVTMNTIALLVSVWLLSGGTSSARAEYKEYLVQNAAATAWLEGDGRRHKMKDDPSLLHYTWRGAPLTCATYAMALLLQVMGVVTFLQKGRRARQQEAFRRRRQQEGSDNQTANNNSGDQTSSSFAEEESPSLLLRAHTLVDEPELLWDR